VAGSLQDPLIWGLLFSSMFPPQSFKALNSHDISVLFQRTTFWNPQFGGHEDFLMVSTKTPQALCH
jgi:hypothetical protein